MLERALWEKAAVFHGHTCPGLAIGLKACEGAVAELGLDASALPAIDEEIVCVTENDACGVDAVQVLLGCTYGKSNLIPRLCGKMAFSFFLRESWCFRWYFFTIYPCYGGRCYLEWTVFSLPRQHLHKYHRRKPAKKHGAG